MKLQTLILDVGCGDRPKGDVNLDLFQAASVDLEGLRGEVKPHNAANFVHGTVYHLPFKKNVFTKVLCHHLIEHLKHPKKAVSELIRVSKYETEIIVPYKWHELIQNMFLPKRRAWAKQHHLWNFTKKQLETLFAEMNLHPAIRYRYKFLSALKGFKQTGNYNFKQFLVYGLLEAVLPPTPGELIATIIKDEGQPCKR